MSYRTTITKQVAGQTRLGLHKALECLEILQNFTEDKDTKIDLDNCHESLVQVINETTNVICKMVPREAPKQH